MSFGMFYCFICLVHTKKNTRTHNIMQLVTELTGVSQTYVSPFLLFVSGLPPSPHVRQVQVREHSRWLEVAESDNYWKAYLVKPETVNACRFTFPHVPLHGSALFHRCKTVLGRWDKDIIKNKDKDVEQTHAVGIKALRCIILYNFLED